MARVNGYTVPDKKYSTLAILNARRKLITLFLINLFDCVEIIDCVCSICWWIVSYRFLKRVNDNYIVIWYRNLTIFTIVESQLLARGHNVSTTVKPREFQTEHQGGWFTSTFLPSKCQSTVVTNKNNRHVRDTEARHLLPTFLYHGDIHRGKSWSITSSLSFRPFSTAWNDNFCLLQFTFRRARKKWKILPTWRTRHG